jgi:6-phosphogluconolactonase (cycloisomerase 2 family)
MMFGAVRGRLALLCAVTLLAGCSGYRGGAIPGQNSSTGASSLRSPLAAANPSVPPYTIYVSNVCGNNAIETFPAGQEGNSPMSVIGGSNTKLSEALWLYDSTGNSIWAGNYGNQSVAVFRVGSAGNVAPSIDLAGTNLGGWRPAGITRDASGNTYVADYAGSRILVFSIDATGNASPTRIISGAKTGLSAPYGLIFDASGNLVVASSSGNSIETFAANSSGNVSPIRTIQGSATGLNRPLGIALDHSGNLDVSNGTANSIETFAVGAAGNVAPTLKISGAQTGLGFPSQIGLDPYGNVYAANRSANTITEYAAGASGNAAPSSVVGGLSCPAGLVVVPPMTYGQFGGASNSADAFDSAASNSPLTLAAYRGFSVTVNFGPNDAHDFCTDCNSGWVLVSMADATNSGDISAPDPPYTGPGKALLYLEAKFANGDTTTDQIGFYQTPDIVIEDTNPGGFGGTSCAIALYGTDGVWSPNFTPSEAPNGTSIHFPPSTPPSSPWMNLYLYESYYALYCN